MALSDRQLYRLIGGGMQFHPFIKAHQVGTEAHCNVTDLIRVGLDQLLQDTSEVVVLCFPDHNKQLCGEKCTTSHTLEITRNIKITFL